MAAYPGVYRIKNVETGTYMTMTSTGTKTSIVCSEAGERDKQSLWRLVAVSGGKHKLRNLEHNLEAHTGQDFYMIGEPNGHSWLIRNENGDERIIDSGNHNVILEGVKATKKVQLKLDKSQKNQRWIFEPASDPDRDTEPQLPPGDYPVSPDIYILKNVKTGTVMDLDGAKEGENVRIFGFQANGGTNQKWNIQPGSKAPSMTIRCLATDTYAAYPAFEQGATLRSSAQPHEYDITSADKGFYISPVQKSDYVLDLTGAGEADETEICLWVKHTGDHQKWYFEAP
ncbi:unnamed protein product [Rhizoctonia solani]|uniref:Ricin B lectin domain-containing protein n=1 Tax=Rhizoctonia solani TaxID=456999 RepID=A0A8H3D196_9AGAM|nr:unnamed protein product [Rhizoctonia solani]